MKKSSLTKKEDVWFYILLNLEDILFIRITYKNKFPGKLVFLSRVQNGHIFHPDTLYDSVAQWICHVKLTLLHITMDYYQTVIQYCVTPLHSLFLFWYPTEKQLMLEKDGLDKNGKGFIYICKKINVDSKRSMDEI